MKGLSKVSLRSRRIRGGVGEEEENSGKKTQLNFAGKPVVNAWDRLCVGDKFSHMPQRCPRWVGGICEPGQKEMKEALLAGCPTYKHPASRALS